MKWLLRGIGLIIFLFVVTCVVGFFLPSTQTVERSVQVDAYPEDVFPFLNDLHAYSQWAPLYAQIVDAQTVYGGADSGVGQTMAWQNGSGAYPFGSQEVSQSLQGEFVQVTVNLSGQFVTATHAILPSEDGESVTVLTKSEMRLGGFPYIQRVRAKLRQGGLNKQFDRSLKRLKTITEVAAVEVTASE